MFKNVIPAQPGWKIASTNSEGHRLHYAEIIAWGFEGDSSQPVAICHDGPVEVIESDGDQPNAVVTPSNWFEDCDYRWRGEEYWLEHVRKRAAERKAATQTAEAA